MTVLVLPTVLFVVAGRRRWAAGFAVFAAVGISPVPAVSRRATVRLLLIRR
jgi:hypothetical protein